MDDKAEKTDPDAFWRRLVLPEEDRPPEERRSKGFRWFRSPNVIDLQRYRHIPNRTNIRNAE
jgi:hypothetical protein